MTHDTDTPVSSEINAPPGPRDHAITPLKNSARQLSGAHANLLDPRHYPIEALCLECGQPVRCERYVVIGATIEDDWIHIERFTLGGNLTA